MKKEALQKLEAMRKQAEINSTANTDEQALQVSSLYPSWEDMPVGRNLAAGERVNYAGSLYKVLQEHVKQENWTPTAAASLFAKILIPNPDVVPEWEQPDSTNPYAKGDRVLHNGKIWESLVDSNVWEPGATGSEALWKEV